METCLLLNGMTLHGSVDEQEQLMLALGAGRLTRAALTDWLEHHVSSVTPSPLFTAVVRAACVGRPSRVDRPS